MAYSKISELGARMYKGKRPTGESITPDDQSGIGGSNPTVGPNNN